MQTMDHHEDKQHRTKGNAFAPSSSKQKFNIWDPTTNIRTYPTTNIRGGYENLINRFKKNCGDFKLIQFVK